MNCNTKRLVVLNVLHDPGTGVRGIHQAAVDPQDVYRVLQADKEHDGHKVLCTIHSRSSPGSYLLCTMPFAQVVEWINLARRQGE